MFESAFAQPLQNRLLCNLRLVQQRVIHKAAFLGFRLKVRSLAEVGLIGKHNEKFRLLPIRSVFHHPRCDLVRCS
jgi:hypothetical protein